MIHGTYVGYVGQTPEKALGIRRNLITTAQAAERLGVSARRVRALIKAGRLAAHRINSRLYLVDAGEVDRLERVNGRPRLNR